MAGTDERSRTSGPGGLVLAALALAILAGGLRFYRLGDWPFYGDELATIEEADVLFGRQSAPPDSQTYRLPRLVPLAYGVHFLDYELFGRDEFGSRVVIALLGALHIVVVFVGIDRLLGRPAAVATALLLALWPEHLFQSQQNRFYMTAALFSSASMLAGAAAVRRRSPGWAAVACVAAFAAVLAHTLQALTIGGLFVSIVVASVAGRRPLPWRILAVVVGGGLVIGAFGLLYVVPLMRGWNSGEGWGYSSAHGLLAAINQLGWPVALLAGVGAVLAVERRSEQGWYWLTWAALWAAASMVLPRVVVYHPAYVFPLALGAVVLAGQATAAVYERLRESGRWAAAAWVGAVCLLNFPGLVSHFRDGSRYDFRTAARYVADHWRTGDRVVSLSPRLLGYYADKCRDATGLRAADPLADIEPLTRAGSRLWIVLPSDRGGKPEPLRHWLGTHCRQELEVRQPRLDYRDFVVVVYLFAPGVQSSASE